ncbi:hypothetical protein KZX46_21755 (plasmid) [Polymorphobacter sp. PAMC 29334]|uniref:hypothetical protein n=1 Tax=Polymorphobacter sp. PAMC 29334 TaxID=2862331 RepID=UPI001C794570|nr:hypothetical protein [Polymorphobacter sp. PAMC 29334]QYE37260.1 hypothetical protein KZX46_21755 [Polymorphobacter sp. PAMC 29334]
MKSDPNDLDDKQLSALLDWKQRKGRSWKNDLLFAWQNGRDEQDPRSASLRWIRNHRGPSWLVDLHPCDLDTAAAARGVTALSN